CVENLVVQRHRGTMGGGRYRPVFAGGFGLGHGGGLANYLQSLCADRVALPLFGFNVGIEMGQIVVLLLAGVALAALDRVLVLVTRPQGVGAVRLRVVAVSTFVALVAARWAVERSPF